MEHETKAQPQETPRTRWQLRMAARPLPPVQTTWGMEVAPLYTPEDVQHIDDACDLGYPGEFPFTRGVYPSMYRGRLWTFREYSGFGTAEDSNARYRALLDQGMTGLSVAFDLPTQIGFDSDDPRVGEEVGRVGVAIDSLADMEILFDGIPLNRVSTNRISVKFILSSTIFPLSLWERVRVRGLHETLATLIPAFSLRERASIISGPGMQGGKR